MSELIPCPFCGGKNVLSTELQDGLPFIAYCQCGAENEAENWNTRPIEDKLRKRIAELEAAQRWIPVTEKLPELDQDVWAIVDGELAVGWFYQEFEGATHFSTDDDALLVATHWMPLPKLPEVQE